MIEKLDAFHDTQNGIDNQQLTHCFMSARALVKLNDLIDIVNALVEENNIHEKQIDELQMKVGHMEDGVVCKVFDNTNSKTQRDLEIAIDALNKIALVDDAGAQMVATAREALTKIGNITPR